MNTRIWFIIGSIIFLIGAVKIFLTHEIVGKAGYINFGENSDIISVILVIISLILFYAGIKNKET